MTRVLVVRLSAMGDVVQAAGAVRALREARADLELAWVVQAPFAPLVERCAPGIAVFAHDRGGGPGAYLRTARALRAWRPDVALDLQGNWKSAGLARLSGAPRRVGSGRGARREPSSALLLNQRLEPGTRHPAAQALAILATLEPGLEAGLEVGPPRLDAPPGEVAAEAEALRRLGVDPDRPFRLLVLGDPADLRAIRPAALVREAAAAPLPCVAVAGPDEVRADAPPGVPRLAHGRGELHRLVALGAVVAAAGGDVFGPDKGPSHVLAAAGAPTRVAFGPTDPARTGPPRARALVAPSPPECAPCRRRACSHADGPVCMDFTTAEARAARPTV